MPESFAVIDTMINDGSKHRAGSMRRAVLVAMARFMEERRIAVSLETGCGRSTALIASLSDAHHVFAFDDRIYGAQGSVSLAQRFIQQPERVTWHFGPTQTTLPSEAPEFLDFALIDGPHGYPFPELEYWTIYPRLREGAVLVVDDIQIPTVRRLFDFIAADAMFDLLDVVGTTAFFRRSRAPACPPLGDDWYAQGYNIGLWPIDETPVGSVILGKKHTFSGGQNRNLLGRGWRSSDPKGVWSIAPEFSLRFRPPSAERLRLTIDFWVPKENAGQQLVSRRLIPESPDQIDYTQGGSQSIAMDIPARRDLRPVSVEFHATWAKPDTMRKAWGIFICSIELLGSHITDDSE